MFHYQENERESLASTLVLLIEKVINVGGSRINVVVTNLTTNSSKTIYAADKYSISQVLSETIEFQPICPDDVLRFEVFARQAKSSPLSRSLGRADWSVDKLCRRPVRVFPLADHNQVLLTGPDGGLSFLEVRLVMERFPMRWPSPMTRPVLTCPKHVMLITRGTRGDVQPFVALALGLTNLLGWEVTLCTELRYKGMVDRMMGARKQGAFHFRPTGGDTTHKIEGTVSRKAMSSKSELMQALMLSRSEAEFFSSEAAIYHWASTIKPVGIIYGFTLTNIAIYHWASTIKPVGIIYGFTLTNIAMICSESLQIPIVGFLLQPTVVPSAGHSPVTPLSEGRSKIGLKFAQLPTTHSAQLKLRTVMEDAPFEANALHKIRERRNLPKIAPGTALSLLCSQNSPIVVPINEDCFGGKPADWPSSVEFTDFIHLRDNTPLDPEYLDFIRTARANKRPLVLMASSSMPIEREDILAIACKLVQQCEPTPAVIAIVGDHPLATLSQSMQSQVDGLKRQGLLLEDHSAPFHLLLPEMDCNIVHGGLGTTSEALRAGKPTIVTGILLMDQRFWGHRMHELGVGPECCHISDFGHYCVEWVNEAIRPGCFWAENARKIAQSLSRTDGGLRLNAAAIQRWLKRASPVVTTTACALPRRISLPPSEPEVEQQRSSALRRMTIDVVKRGRDFSQNTCYIPLDSASF